MQYFVYILKCCDLSYYTGITNNLEKRLNEHILGEDKNSYTYNKKPFELVYFESFDNPLVAIEREKQIKGWSRKKKEALIKGDFNLLKKLSERYQSSRASD